MDRDQAIAALTAPGQQFELVEEDVLGVRMRVYRNAPPSMRDMLVSSRAHGDLVHLVFEDERFTFDEHYRIAVGLAHRLLDRYGLEKGDRVAIGMRNYPEWPMAFWAVQAAGLVAVPLNAWWTGAELEYALRDSGASVLVADGERLAEIRPYIDTLDLKGTIAVRDANPVPSEEQWLDVKAELDLDAPLPDVPIAPDDDSTILYTSGTTGLPKGAVGTHRNHATNLMNTVLGAMVGGLLAPPSPAAGDAPSAPPTPPAQLQTFPFFHIGGLSGLYISAVFGMKLVLMYKWDVQKALDLIEREHVTGIAGVPLVVRQLVESGELERRAPQLANVASGGAPVPPDLVHKIDDKFASKVSPGNGYGLTETTSAVVSNGGREYVEHPDSVGRPVPCAEVRIVDPDTGEDAPTGRIGEVWMKGPNVVKGYWNKVEATAASFTDGWFHSGDLGYFDDNGLLYVVDRLKDVIIRGGENIYSAEVEAVMFEHPEVEDCALIGIPDQTYGEQPVAVVVRKPGSTLEAGGLQEFVAQHLARFKVPAHVLFWDEPLPRTGTGKVLKRDLRDQATGRLGR